MTLLRVPAYLSFLSGVVLGWMWSQWQQQEISQQTRQSGLEERGHDGAACSTADDRLVD
jgi:hypothetical protein